MTRKILRVLEIAWITAAVVALLIAAYNLYKEPVFNHKIYFPIFVAIFCIVVYITKRRHRNFLEKFKDQSNNQ